MHGETDHPPPAIIQYWIPASSADQPAVVLARELQVTDRRDDGGGKSGFILRHG